MGTWKTYKLGDVCFLADGEVRRGWKGQVFDVKSLRSHSKGKYATSGRFVHQNTYVILVDGENSGELFQIPEDGYMGSTFRQLSFSNEICSTYLRYFLSYQRLRFKKSKRGAAIPHLDRTLFANLSISLPPLEEQERIAGVLGAYDDLIAVNERRMALLEEAAHRLYRDRFVTHANSDWPLRPLGEVAPLRRGKIITEATAQPGCVPVVAGGLEPAYWHNQANTTAPVLTVAGSGANAGFARLYYEDVWASDCSYVDRSEQAPVYFAYCFLKDNKRKIENFKRGAAQPHVYPADLNALEGHFDRESIQTFEAQVSPYFEAIGVLARENVLLREGRDKLLPRLLREEA